MRPARSRKDRTGEPFLLDLAAKMHTQGVDWTGATPTRHNVNIAQGFREPAQYGRLTGSADLTRATYRAYDTVMAAYGRFPGGDAVAHSRVCPTPHGSGSVSSWWKRRDATPSAPIVRNTVPAMPTQPATASRL